jgi:hypothetical protein
VIKGGAWRPTKKDLILLYPRAGRCSRPKNGNTREGAISDGTLALIQEWADLAQDPTPDGLVFPSEKLTSSLSLDNLWRRSMCPKLEAVGFEWATFQVLRKTNAVSERRRTSIKENGVCPGLGHIQCFHSAPILALWTSAYSGRDEW